MTVGYRRQGHVGDPVVVLVHPWGESSGTFERLVDALPPGLDVVAMDHRGHGASEALAHGYDLHTSAEDVVALLDALGIPSGAMVGSSSGGYVAQQIAVSHPDRVNALVLVGAPRSLAGRPPFADDIERLTDPVSSDWVRESLVWFPTFHAIPQWFVEHRVEDGARIQARVWQDHLRGLFLAVPPTATGEIAAPTLILWGQNDELLPREDQEGLAATIPDSRLVEYPDTGHLVLWEQPARVAADVTAFLSSLGLRSRAREAATGPVTRNGRNEAS